MLGADGASRSWAKVELVPSEQMRLIQYHLPGLVSLSLYKGEEAEASAQGESKG